MTGDHDHEKCCRYLYCAHPVCCGYYGDQHVGSKTETAPNPDQPGRCPSIDPHDTLQCGRSIHEDDRCRFGGIAWKKGTPRYVSDRERALREALTAIREVYEEEDVPAVKAGLGIAFDAVRVVLNAHERAAETRVLPPAKPLP